MSTVPNTSSHWDVLAEAIHTFPDRPSEWRMREEELFMEVEALLYLYVSLTPESHSRSAGDAWALVSGYTIAGLNDAEEQRSRCLRLRMQLRYVRNNTGWKKWLRWYRQQPDPLLMYKFDGLPGDDSHFDLKRHEVSGYSQRLAAYEERCTQTPLTKVPDRRPFAPEGLYQFEANGVAYEVKISSAMAALARHQQPPILLPHRAVRPSIHIDLAVLRSVAEGLDTLECKIDYQPRGNWVDRLGRLQLHRFEADETLKPTSTLNIENVFHLVGKLGVGKSTLIWLIAYYLISHQNMHVTIVLNTVVETLRMAEWLIKMGVKATPVLGRDRHSHLKKYAAVTHERLNADSVFDPQTEPAPVFQWLPSVCALSGAVIEGIPHGSEPCARLRDQDGETYRCPLMPVCPVHEVKRRMLDAQVWLVNPQSFLYSAAPEGLGSSPLRLLEAVYHRSDLVIVDEVDRVQVQWDMAFAPIFPVAGGDDSLLDVLHPLLGQASVGRKGRRRSADAMFNRLLTIDNQAHTLASHLFRLIEKSDKLVEWIDRSQLTSQGMFRRLVRELLSTLPPDTDQYEAETTLDEIFINYWQKGKRGSGEAMQLVAWVEDLMTSTDAERRTQKRLEKWLTRLIGWTLPLNDKQLLFVRKLDFCLTLSALLKRINDILFLLPPVDLGVEPSRLVFSLLREELIKLVPDAPIGAELGAKHIGYERGESAGIFALLAYRGIGRWLLTNFPNVYRDINGASGAKLLMMSATSWLPGAASFDVTPHPHALLLPITSSDNRIHIEFKPAKPGKKPLPVSGAGEAREDNLAQIVRALTTPNGRNPSDLQRELEHWETRRVLLVVNSYEQVTLVFDTLQSFPEWRGRVRKLTPDYRTDEFEGILRAGQVEAFRDHDADILIAPLLAIQRGFNILDEEDRALLGSVFFLVRPFPPPGDIAPQILGLNQWTMQRLEKNTQTLEARYSQLGIQGVAKMRRDAYSLWNKRIKSGNWGLDSLSEESYQELLRDQFILIWQTIGRLLRGDQDARVFFVDATFASSEGRNILRDWYELLHTLVSADSPRERTLGAALYQLAYKAFQRADERGVLG